MSSSAAREFVEGLAAEVHRKVWLQMLLYGEVRQCASCGYICDGPGDVHECEVERDDAPGHREDCDRHECERGELRRQFANDAIGRWPR